LPSPPVVSQPEAAACPVTSIFIPASGLSLLVLDAALSNADAMMRSFIVSLTKALQNACHTQKILFFYIKQMIRAEFGFHSSLSQLRQKGMFCRERYSLKTG
jgi:hypothetical protein